MKKVITLFSFIVLFVFTSKSQRITVGDPQEEWWYYNQGTIEDAEITIHPQGLYLEIGMYLTFSGKDHYYTNQDTIELVCDFSLPDGSIVHDSWLWYNQDTLIAEIMDRWTANSIYNEIVGRRQDPSILYKTWNNNYELRIYPMKGDSTRRVKIAYLLPLQFTSTSVFAALPLDIIKLSMHEVKGAKFLVKTDDVWKNPIIMEYPELVFEDFQSEKYNTNKLLTINSDNYGNQFTIQFDSPIQDGIFVNHVSEEEDYFQLAVLPSAFVDDIESKNVMVCVDHEAGDGLLEAEALINTLKYTISNGLAPVDSFNIMFSSLQNEPVAESWVSVKDIDQVFESIDEEMVTSYSLLPVLLSDAVEFINNSDAKGEILLIANSDINGDPEQANDLINDLLDQMGDEAISIHCADYNRSTSNYYRTGSNSYRGNDYLYINLSKLTDANYSKIVNWNQSISQFLFEFTQTIGGIITSFDIHTSMTDGFCYSRFDINSSSGYIYLNKPFLQIGKYYGDFPLNIEIAGLYNNVAFSENVTISLDETLGSDSLIEEAWAGNYIELLEQELSWNSNELIREIIDYSIQERVLSNYTAFLAIEPGAFDSLNIDDDNDDNENVWQTPVAIVEDVKEKVEVEAFPNPFIEEISLKIQLSQSMISQQIAVNIYDITGNLIYSDMLDSFDNKDVIEYRWDGEDASGNKVSKGTYIITVHSDNFREVIKIVKM